MIRPLVAIPVVLAAVAGGVIGAIVGRVTCTAATCTGPMIWTGLLGGVIAAVGVGVVVVLAAMSFDEWRSAEQSGGSPPEPGCESEPAS